MPDEDEFRPVRDIAAEAEVVDDVVEQTTARLEQNRAQQDDTSKYPAMLAALGLAAIGCAIIPVQTHKKDPLMGKRWEETARTYPQTFLRNPGTLNYGVLPPPGCVILDVDGDNPAWMAELAQTLGQLPETRIHASPNGQHWFFRWPDTLPRPSGPWWGRVVARWPYGDDGQGYVVGPGSQVKQPDGSIKAYSVLWDEPIADLPLSWAESVLAYRPPRAVPTPEGMDWDAAGGEPYVLPESVHEGGRYDSIVRYTAHLYNQGLSIAEMAEKVRDELVPRWTKPKSQAELRGDFRRATKDMVDRLGPPAHVPLPGGIVPGSLLDPTSQSDEASVEPTTLDTGAYAQDSPTVQASPERTNTVDPTPLFGAPSQGAPAAVSPEPAAVEPPFFERGDVLADRLRAMGPVPYLLDGLVTSSGLNLIGGHPKSGKSLAALQMQAAWVMGGDFLGHAADQRGHRVAGYVTQEGSRDLMRERLDRLYAAHPGMDATGRFLTAFLKPLLFTKEGYAFMAERISAIESEYSARPGPLDLWLTLDPLRDFMPSGADENDAKHMAEVKRWCRTLLSEFTFLSFTVVHHLRKAANGDTGLELSGSGATYAMTDSTLTWKAKKKDEDEYDDTGFLRTRRPLRGTYNIESRGGEPSGGPWRYDQHSGLIVPDNQRETDTLGRSQPGETQRTVYDLLLDAGGRGITGPEVSALFPELTPAAAGAALLRLYKDGKADQTGDTTSGGRGNAKRYYGRGWSPANDPAGLVPPDESEDFTPDPLHPVD